MQVRASHLLIKHRDSRRPASWKDNNITRSKQDAIEILKQHQQTLAQSPDLAQAFAALAKTESDCSSARDGGDLSQSLDWARTGLAAGWCVKGGLGTGLTFAFVLKSVLGVDYFGRNQMQKPFEDATFATPVGHLSDIVDTDSGVHSKPLPLASPGKHHSWSSRSVADWTSPGLPGFVGLRRSHPPHRLNSVQPSSFLNHVDDSFSLPCNPLASLLTSSAAAGHQRAGGPTRWLRAGRPG